MGRTATLNIETVTLLKKTAILFIEMATRATDLVAKVVGEAILVIKMTGRGFESAKPESFTTMFSIESTE